MENRKKSREGVEQIPLGGEEEQVQQVAQELALMHLVEVAPPLWQEPAQVQGRALQAGVVGPQSGREMLHSWVLAPELWLEWLVEVTTTGGGHSYRSGAASWSAQAWSSSGCKTGVEAGAGSASWAGAGVARGGKITHVLAFPCAPPPKTGHCQGLPEKLQPRTHPRTSSPRPVQHTGGLRPVFAPAQPLRVLLVCPAPTPSHPHV